MNTTQSVMYCESCNKETKHTIECIRDATIPPNEDTASESAIIFYMNGESEYEYTCNECGWSRIEI